MKRHRLYLFILALSYFCSLQAQNKEQQSFRFIYITHDNQLTDVLELRTHLEDGRRIARDEAAIIWYLSNGASIVDEDSLSTDLASPVIVTYNIRQDEGEDDLDQIFMELNKNSSHAVRSKVDLENILKLLERYDCLDREGNILYKNLYFEFYVTEKFWDDKDNENIIAALYFILDFKRLMDNNEKSGSSHNISFDIYYCDKYEIPKFAQTQKEHTDESNPLFGRWNINEINNVIDYRHFMPLPGKQYE